MPRLTLWCALAAALLISTRLHAQGLFSNEDRDYWAFRPVTRPAVPHVADAAWVRNPIDAFLLARLQAEGLGPAPQADRLTLLRRAVFDLHGLPPTPEQASRFLNDEGPRAYEELIDRLLASPRYGERWARHWLDLVRYAETDGYNQDAERPLAWRYRDYVIRALNEDKPYDRFVAEQVAGDEIAPDDPDALVATGFLRHWPYEYNQRNVPQQRMFILNDLTDVAGHVFLGLTVRCARCHDHKFDAILQDDYFRLQAFFTPLVADDVQLAGAAEQEDYRRRLEEWESATAEIRAELAELEARCFKDEQRRRKELFPPDIQAMMETAPKERTPLEQQLAGLAEKQLVIAPGEKSKFIKGDDKQRWAELRKQLSDFNKLKPPAPARVMAVRDVGAVAPPTIVPDYGDLEDPSTYIAPGFLSVLDAAPAEVQPRQHSTGRRAALADWLTSPENPLVARVMVNRLWQHHFRRGLVATPNDVGRQGETCTHPELLDWLASEFVARGWSLKAMHRLMMTSAAYRQASRCPPGPAAERDPENKLLWRMRGGRLEAEVIRDAMLSASGELNLKMGGPSVYPQLPPGISDRHAWSPTKDAAERNRRSVYLFVKRNLLHPLLESFDMPHPSASCARRQVTTTAPQALNLLNGAWALGRAKSFTSRLLEETAEIDASTVRRAYELAFARLPDEDETAAALDFLATQAAIIEQRLDGEDEVLLPEPMPKFAEPARAAALVDFCHALLNSNEFVYVD